jgi:hypothetical protein
VKLQGKAEANQERDSSLRPEQAAQSRNFKEIATLLSGARNGSFIKRLSCLSLNSGYQKPFS